MDSDRYESFINNCLKEDLKEYEKQIKLFNEETLEYIQLKNMIECIKDNFADGLKTQMNVGGNFFIQAKIPDTKTILVDVGLHHYVEFNLEEALRFVQMKINILNKKNEIVREESLKTRANIKLALLCIGSKEHLINS